MAIGGAFLGGGVELVPAGYCKLSLQIMTDDRSSLGGTFTISGGGNSYSVTAGTDGRAEKEVPSGETYTVSVSVTGFNSSSQIVIAESSTIKYVRFDIFKSSYGTNTRPIKIVNGIPTPVDNDLATDSLVVHLAGTEEITGTKTFSNAVTLSSSGVVASGDSHAVSGGEVYTSLTNGTVSKIGTSNVGTNVKPIILVNGVPTPVANDLAKDSEVIHLAGTENITGEKTFKNNVYIGATGSGNAKNLTQVGNINLTGNLTIEGDIIQNGSSYETHAQEIYTTNDYIFMRDGATGALSSGSYSGFQVKKYDGTNDGRLVIDVNGVARVGDVGDEQPLMTRKESGQMTNGALLKWDNANLRAISEGSVGDNTHPIILVNGVATPVSVGFVDTANEQYISGNKIFNNPLSNKSSAPLGTLQYPTAIQQIDSNGNFMYSIRCVARADGSVEPYMTVRQAGGSQKDISLVGPAGWKTPYDGREFASATDILVTATIGPYDMVSTLVTGPVYSRYVKLSWGSNTATVLISNGAIYFSQTSGDWRNLQCYYR